MILQLTEVQTEKEFADVAVVEHEAYSKPFNSFWEVLKGPDIAECTARQWSWHTATPNSHWLKVSDKETGETIGAAEWIIHRENPFAKPSEPLTATWWPEGELKDLSNQMITQFMAGRPPRMNRPHLLIQYCFVSSRHRRRGAGRLLMEWGCNIADEMDLEAFVESTDDGKELYEAYGFHAVNPFYLHPDTEEPNHEWKVLKERITPEPYRVWFMWRPKGGVFVPGKTVYSWEEK